MANTPQLFTYLVMLGDKGLICAGFYVLSDAMTYASNLSRIDGVYVYIIHDGNTTMRFLGGGYEYV